MVVFPLSLSKSGAAAKRELLVEIGRFPSWTHKEVFLCFAAVS